MDIGRLSRAEPSSLPSLSNTASRSLLSKIIVTPPELLPVVAPSPVTCRLASLPL